MLIVNVVKDLRGLVHAWRAAGERIAFVPSMGNLHDGHIDLVRHAHDHAQRVVVSIFVNPLQFGRNEDFGSYPRTPDADTAKLREARVDLLFAPGVEEMYPNGVESQTKIEVPGISDILCGAFRPGHFSGVATVVNMLLNQVQPDVALFGEKDFQQLAVIRAMVRDLQLPVEIVGVPTVRSADGLALSSRNQYLTEAERVLAPAIYRLLAATGEALKNGRNDYPVLQQEGMQALQNQGFKPDYFSILRPDLQAPRATDHELVILAAARLGKARLIDNLRILR